jgi:hypothetical protein
MSNKILIFVIIGYSSFLLLLGLMYIISQTLLNTQNQSTPDNINASQNPSKTSNPSNTNNPSKNQASKQAICNDNAILDNLKCYKDPVWSDWTCEAASGTDTFTESQLKSLSGYVILGETATYINSCRTRFIGCISGISNCKRSWVCDKNYNFNVDKQKCDRPCDYV